MFSKKNQNFQRIKYGQHFWVFVLSSRANSKRQETRKPHFSGKRISEMLFHVRISCLKTIKVTWYNGLFGSFFGIWILKVIYMAYLGRVFENLKEKFLKIKQFLSDVSGFSFRAIVLKFMWQISWKILVSFGLGRVQSLKIIYLAYQVESESLTGKIQSFERFKNFQHFWFLLWSIEPIRKDGNDGKLTIWLNSELSFWGFLFEIVDVNHAFRWKELL